MLYNYQTIKSVASQSGLRVTDLIALAAQNDPFYMGTPTDIAMGEWFAEWYEKLGYAYNWQANNQRVHIRRFHYSLVSQSPTALMHNGEPYLNDMKCWGYVLMASKIARYLGLVPVDSFDDKKNPPARMPERYQYDFYDIKPGVQVSGQYENNISLPDFPNPPTYETYGFYADQRYLIEVWAEKTTMDDIIVPLSQQYGFVYQTGAGELSITSARKLAERVRKIDKPTRIFYVSDFDPAGQSMPVAIARKLEFFLRNEDVQQDVRLFPVVLTADQVARYNLPRTPIKETERRKDAFELRHGLGATELDALEAIIPGELRRILMQNIAPYYDTGLQRQVDDVMRGYHRELGNIRRDILARHQDEIDELQRLYESARSDFMQRVSAVADRIQETWQAIEQELEDEKLSAPELPEGRIAVESGNELYNSERDYVDQIAAYKEFQGKY